MSMKSRIRNFFGTSRQYAVVGASKNPTKFGYRILLWYVSHNLPVVPVNPKEQTILGQRVVASVPKLLASFDTTKKIDGHGDIEQGLSISFLTPPQTTYQTLNEISEFEGYEKIIKGLWLQPGSYDQLVLKKAEQMGLGEVLIENDECILVRGEEGMYSANL